MNGKELRRCSCGAVMRFTYTADFRIGTGGKLKLLFGELPDAGISLLPLNVHICPDCGKIELFAGEAIKDALLRIADKNKQQTSPSSL